MTTTAPAYADDLSAVANTIPNLAIQASKIHSYADWANLRINTDKSAITGRHTPGANTQYIAQYARISYTHPDKGPTTYPCLPPRSTYKYLGVHISLSLEWATNATHVMAAVRKKISKLKYSWATPDQRVEILKSAIIPKATYAAATGTFDLRQLHILDTMIGTSMKEATGMGKSAKRAFSFAPKVEGAGLGLPSVQAQATKAMIRHMSGILNENGDIAQAVTGIVTVLHELRGSHLHEIHPRGHLLPQTRFLIESLDKRICTLRRIHMTTYYDLTAPPPHLTR